MSDILTLDELDILDKQLDDIEDLAGFEVPVNGRYGMDMTAAVKPINDKPAVELSFTVTDLVEQQKEEDKPTAIGTKFSLLFFLAGEEDAVKMSLGRLKELMVPVGEHFGTSNLKEILGKLVDPLNVEGTVKRRYDKEDKEKIYGSVKSLSVR